ncbi:MAG: GNAT family N-acetyltransferase [Verrucomicrobiota bacterium]
MLIKTTHGHAKIVRSAKEVDQALWQCAMAPQCQDCRYYEVIEETLKEPFDYRYAILTNTHDDRATVQPFFFVDQDITAGLPKRLRALAERVRRAFPRFLNYKIAMVGCAAAEGQLACAEPWALQMLHEAIDVCARVEGAKVVLFKDFPSIYRDDFRHLTRLGYTRVPSMPAAKLHLDFKSFEDYMTRRLSRIYRKNLRRKFRDSDRFGALRMEVVRDVTPHIEEVFSLYQQTFRRSEFRFEELTKNYFCELGRRMPERVRFFLWRDGEQIVAFAVCMIHGDVLHDLNVGMDYSVALDRHLYFVTLRDIVSWALNENLKIYQTGPLNYDPKLHLRLDLAPQDLYARHLSPMLNPIFGWALHFLEPTRHDPILRKFANSHEL